MKYRTFEISSVSSPGENEREKVNGFTFRDCQGRRPLFPKDVQTDRTVRVDVWVINLCSKVDLGRFERVIRWELNR